jgi:hypothetical protein
MGGDVPPLPNTPSWHGTQLGGAHGPVRLADRYINILKYCQLKTEIESNNLFPLFLIVITVMFHLGQCAFLFRLVKF